MSMVISFKPVELLHAPKIPNTNVFSCCMICRHIYGVQEFRVELCSGNSLFPHLKLIASYQLNCIS